VVTVLAGLGKPAGALTFRGALHTPATISPDGE
jgi:hypothetical protein